MGSRIDRRRQWQARRGVGLAAVAVLALLAAIVAWQLLGGDSATEREGAEVREIEVDSEAVDARQPVSLVVPDAEPAGEPALLIFLHGRSGDHRSHLVPAMLTGLERLGERAPVVAFPDGGYSSFWHNRSSGDWERYLVEEVIPAAAEASGADPDRVAIGGISMGGLGAFDVARLNPGRFCAVGGHSPAIWASAEVALPDAFDDARDFARHDLLAAAATDPAGLDGPPLWLDIGDQDPFLGTARAFVGALRSSGVSIEAHVWPGGHEPGYWSRNWPRYLRFYAANLADC